MRVLASGIVGTTLRVLVLAFLAQLLTACGGGSSGGGGGAPITLSRIDITPSAPAVEEGATRQLTATAVYSNGRTENVTAMATWLSAATATATVGDSGASKGLLTGVASGSTMISASFGGRTGSVTATVTVPVTLDRVEIAPANPSLAKGTTRQLVATAVYSDGTTLNVTATSNWSSATPAIATIGNTAGNKGLLGGAAVGTAEITAIFEGESGSTMATVTAATPVSVAVSPTDPSLPDGTTQQLTATATFTDGSTQDVTSMATWTSSASSIATVSDSAGSKGAVTAVNLGSATISAAFMSLNASSTVTVTPAVPVSVSVTPSNPAVPRGTTQQFAAMLIFSDGSMQDVTSSANWASSTPAVATVGNSAGSKGLAAAIAAGTSSISATAMGVSGSTTMTVTAASITSIDVTPKARQLASGFDLQFAATATLSDGSTRDVTSDVSWTATNTAAATISNASGSKGLATGVAPGTTSIVAQNGAIQGSTTLTVSGASLTSIQVSPANPSIALGSDQQFTATGTFSDSSTQDLTRQVTWSSSVSAVATISNAEDSRGLSSSVAVGSTTISASSTGSAVTGSTVLTVTAAELVSIEVAPDPAAVAVGLTRQLSATGTYTDGTTQDITTFVTWSSTDVAVATVSNAAGSEGLVTGASEGETTIAASLSGVSDSATLTVTAAELQSIAVTPSAPMVPQGLPQSFIATGSYSDGSVQDLTDSVTWASSDIAVATISNADGSRGVASTQTQGATTISATSGGVSGDTTLTVTPVALVSISVTPVSPSVAKGLALQLAATGNYSDGSTIDLTTTVTWSSANPAVADVSNASGSKGRVNAADIGSTSVTSTDSSSGVSGGTTITVTTAALTGIVVTPANAVLPAGFTLSFTAIGNFSDGSSQNITEQVTWTSLNPDAATVGNSASTKGQASGISAGTTTIIASLGSTSGQTGLTVSAETLVSINVSPASTTLAAGATQQYQADGTFSSGSVLRITSQVVWASSNTGAATVSNADSSRGLVTAGPIPLSSSTISAARNGITGTATVSRSLP